MTRPTEEFFRVRDLPRRVLTEAYARQCAAVITQEMRVRGSRAECRPWQGCAIVEAVQNDGAVLALPVGVGKTLVSYLLPRAMGAKRTLLVVPASLREKAMAEFQALFKDWGDVGTILKIVSVSELAVESGEKLIEGFRPDLIISDECQKLRHAMRGAPRRIDRYVVAHPEVRVVCMTGTLSRKSIMGYWHMLGWALRDRMPLPQNQGEAEAWDAVLGEGSGPWAGAADPGVLGRSVAEAVAWYRKRLTETPGVVILDIDSAGDVPLHIRWRLAPEDPALDRAYERFLIEQENPGGITVSDPLSRWRLDAQMSAGLYTRYKYPPPKEWMQARRESARFVRDAVEASTNTPRPLDTEAQVFRRFPRAPEVAAWKAIKDTFTPVTEYVWLTSSVVEAACAWLRESRTPGIVWVDTVDFGRALAHASGLAYYGAKGINGHGVSILRADPRVSLIASWHACREGFNLQAWTRNLVIQLPQSSEIWEQMLGRPHRSGARDAVTFDVMIGSGGSIDAFEAALREAGRVKAREGVTQKLLRAKIDRATQPRLTPGNSFRWATRTKQKGR